MADVTPEQLRMIDQISDVSGLSKDTVKELFSKGWTFISEYKKPLRFELDLLSELELNRG